MPTTNQFLITIEGEKASGKTLLLLAILDALADNAFLTHEDTKEFTEAPRAFMNYARIVNLEKCEAIEIDIDTEQLLKHVYHLERLNR